MDLEKVRKLYLEDGYNCAEATLMAIAKGKGMNLSAEDIKLIGAFGGGGQVQLAANRERKSERVSVFC